MVETWAKLIEALAQLAWPALAGFAIWRLAPFLGRAIQGGPVKIKIGDNEVSIQQASNQISEQLNDVTQKLAAMWPRVMGDESAERVARGAIQSYPTSILWVDDRPENNAFYIEALRSNEIRVVEALSTEDALATLKADGSGFQAIISDMGRKEGVRYRATAGLELIRRVRETNAEIPILIFATREAVADYGDKVRELGGQGITDSIVELLRLLRMPQHIVTAA